LLLELRLLALVLHLRIADEILPTKNHEQRQHDGQNGVLVLAHSMLVLNGPFFGSIWRLPPPPLDRPALCGDSAPDAPVPPPLLLEPLLPAALLLEQCLLELWTRRSAPPSSFTMASKATLSAARRPIST